MEGVCLPFSGTLCANNSETLLPLGIRVEGGGDGMIAAKPQLMPEGEVLDLEGCAGSEAAQETPE